MSGCVPRGKNEVGYSRQIVLKVCCVFRERGESKSVCLAENHRKAGKTGRKISCGLVTKDNILCKRFSVLYRR